MKQAIADTVNLPRQYILCQSSVYIPSNWQTKQSGEWYLGHDNSLPVGELRDARSQFIGWLIGYPITPEGKIAHSLKLSVEANSDRFVRQFETSIYKLGGRFVAIFLGETVSRLYLDPAGTLATVYCPQQQIVASTVTLIPYNKECDDNRELIELFDIEQKDSWYPFGLTSRNGIERLIPNHFLDLKQWQNHRHWSGGDLRPITDCESGTSEIGNILTTQIRAIANEYPIYMSLTAGRDSRMLLACAKSNLDKIIFFTREIPDKAAKLDCEIASQLADKFHLEYQLLTYQTATEEELQQWLAQTGYCVAGRVWRSVRTLKQLYSDRIYLPGLAAEIGRAYYWRRSDLASEPISAVELLTRMRMPKTQLLQKRAQQWLSRLPFKDRFRVLDLLYLEQRLGCWASPLHYGLVDNGFCLSPFVHRRIIEIMLSLPATYRSKQLLAEDLIRQRWSQLLDLPFNEYTGWKSYLHSKSLKNKVKKLLIKVNPEF